MSERCDVSVPECLLGVQTAVEEERGGQLDTLQAKLLHVSLSRIMQCRGGVMREKK